MTRRPLLALLLAAALALSGCGVYDSPGKTFDIPDTYTTGNAKYTLLYSTVGYDAASTKRLLIRQNDTAAQPETGLAFRWRVVDEKGKEAAAGTASFEETGWGIPIWAADFTKVDRPGTYRISVEAPAVTLATLPFRIDDFLFTRETFIPIALENAEARAAPIELDNGFFESNTREGTAWGHALFLDGLLVAYDARATSMPEETRARTRDAIDRGVDYLLLLSDPATGEVRHAPATRPYQGADPADAAATARALARYGALFQRENPAKAERAYRRARLAGEWLGENAPDEYGPRLRAAVAYDLYRYSTDPALLDEVVKAVREFAPEYDLRSMERRGFDPQPHFETMYLLWQSLPEHPDRPMWIETATRVATQYRDMIERNAFHTVTVAETGDTPADQWDAAGTDRPIGEGDAGVITNEWFMARAIDAVYLASMTDDADLEQAATASILWIAGLNPGIPADRVAGASGDSPLEAASFVVGADGRYVQPWSLWEWQRARPFQTIAAGFRSGFTFDDSEAAAGTSIARDGAWLKAMVAYEDYLHPGRRSAPPEQPGLIASAMRVAATAASEQEEALTLLVTVIDPDGTPLAGVTATGVWAGALLPGAPPESAVRTTSCVTANGGSCALALDAADQLPRPITVSITNLEHRAHPYVPTPGDVDLTATFP